MANRLLKPAAGSLEGGVVTIFAKTAIGASGVSTINASQSKGVTSITRTGAGAYTVTLTDRYARLLSAQATHVLAAGTPAASSNVQMVVRADNSAAAAKTITIAFAQTNGANIELTDGTTLLLELKLKNSTV